MKSVDSSDGEAKELRTECDWKQANKKAGSQNILEAESA